MINCRGHNNNSMRIQVAAAVLKSSTMHPQMQAELARSPVRDREQEQPKIPYPDDHNFQNTTKFLTHFILCPNSHILKQASSIQCTKKSFSHKSFLMLSYTGYLQSIVYTVTFIPTVDLFFWHLFCTKQLSCYIVWSVAPTIHA